VVWTPEIAYCDWMRAAGRRIYVDCPHLHAAVGGAKLGQ
jgi:hypothetical protein